MKPHITSLGELEQAIQDFDKAIELNSFNYEAYLGRGFAYNLTDDMEQAIEDYDRYIELAPTDDPRLEEIMNIVKQLKASIS
jgi:tetratricopeptide (TPR) repeat protein